MTDETDMPPSGLPALSRKMCVTLPSHQISTQFPLHVLWRGRWARSLGQTQAPSLRQEGAAFSTEGGFSVMGTMVALIRVTALQNGVSLALSFLLPLLLDVSCVLAVAERDSPRGSSVLPPLLISFEITQESLASCPGAQGRSG